MARSRIEMSPKPACHDDDGPAPSSLTSMLSPSPADSTSLTLIVVAPECRAALVMASVTIRYAATSTRPAAAEVLGHVKLDRHAAAVGALGQAGGLLTQ